MQFTNSPSGGQVLKTSQVAMQTNMGYFAAVLGKDHQVVFNNLSTTTFEGRHLQISLLNQHGTSYTIADGDDQVVFSDVGTLKSFSSLAGNPTFQITPCFPVLAQVRFAPASLPALESSYNVVAPITKNGVGDYTINFTNPAVTAVYHYSTNFTTGATGVSRAVPVSIANGSIRVQFNNNTNSLVDPVDICIMVYGV